jgi:hypothetical protein
MLIEMLSADPGFWHLAHFTNCDTLALVLFDKPRRRQGHKAEEEDRARGYKAGFGISPRLQEDVGELDFLPIHSCATKFHSQTVAGMRHRYCDQIQILIR